MSDIADMIFVGIDPSLTCTAIVAISADGLILQKAEIRLPQVDLKRRKRRAQIIFSHVYDIMEDVLCNVDYDCSRIVVGREAPFYCSRVSAQTAAGFIQGIVDSATGTVFDDLDSRWFEISVKSWRSLVLGTQSIRCSGKEKAKNPTAYIDEISSHLETNNKIKSQIHSTDVMDAYCVALASRLIYRVHTGDMGIWSLPARVRGALIDSKKRIAMGVTPSLLQTLDRRELEKMFRRF